ncbi:MAG: MAPEG family protein [Pseudomonadota bacterium]|nr:MAPEG family protein [Pseudomonadota bacterium]
MTFVFPALSATTAGAVLILQMLLALTVSGARGKADVWIGAGGNPVLERTARRHANLAENAGLFVVGFTLLELSGRWPTLLLILCPTFLVLRLFHAAGLSRENTNNPLRLIGGAGTYLLGIVLGGALAWLGVVTLLAQHG